MKATVEAFQRKVKGIVHKSRRLMLISRKSNGVITTT